jgi:hypothetical protein
MLLKIMRYYLFVFKKSERKEQELTIGGREKRRSEGDFVSLI